MFTAVTLDDKIIFMWNIFKHQPSALQISSKFKNKMIRKLQPYSISNFYKPAAALAGREYSFKTSKSDDKQATNL